MESKKLNTGPSFWLSIGLIALGFLFLLENFGYFYIDDIWDFWPLVLIVIGLSKLFASNFKDLYSSGFLILLGLIFLLATLNIIYWDDIWDYIWPLILIAIGVRILYNHSFGRDRERAYHGEAQENRVCAGAIFGGKEQHIVSDHFEGGTISAIFGGTDLHFNNAQLAPGKNVLDVFVMFGGIEIYVPADWQVIVKSMPIFGGVDDQRKHVESVNPDDDRTLEIKGLILFGGLEIYNLKP